MEQFSNNPPFVYGTETTIFHSAPSVRTRILMSAIHPGVVGVGREPPDIALQPYSGHPGPPQASRAPSPQKPLEPVSYM